MKIHLRVQMGDAGFRVACGINPLDDRLHPDHLQMSLKREDVTCGACQHSWVFRFHGKPSAPPAPQIIDLMEALKESIRRQECAADFETGGPA